MRQAVLLFLSCCVLAGCAGLDFEEGVKVDVRGDESLPVEVTTHQGKTLPVHLDTQNPQGLPVEVRISRGTAGLAVAVLVVVVLICIVTLVVSIAAVRTAAAASHSAEVLAKNIQQRRKTRVGRM